MRAHYVLAISILTAVSAFCQSPQFTASKLWKTGSITRGTGHVKAVDGDIIATADEGSFNSETGGFELSGRVEISLPERGDHYAVRYATGAFVTSQPMTLMADQLKLKNGLLQASGHVVILPNDPQYPHARLTGEDLAMYVRIGDATLKGNVHTANISSDTPQFRKPRTLSFPPDVIKE